MLKLKVSLATELGFEPTSKALIPGGPEVHAVVADQRIRSGGHIVAGDVHRHAVRRRETEIEAARHAHVSAAAGREVVVEGGGGIEQQAGGGQGARAAEIAGRQGAAGAALDNGRAADIACPAERAAAHGDLAGAKPVVYDELAAADRRPRTVEVVACWRGPSSRCWRP